MALLDKFFGGPSRRKREPQEYTDDQKIILEAQDRLKEWKDWESDFQTLYKDDVKFNNGDSDNGWQWPRDIRKEREANKRPALTINKTAQKVNLIVNDMRQNKPSVAIKPVGEESSYEAAQIWEGLVRHIEYISTAQAIYDSAAESQVEGGIGFWRLNTKFLDDDSFDQDIVIEPVIDMLGVALDPHIREKDGSDAKWAIIFTDLPRNEAERLYPDMDLDPTSVLLGGPDTWLRPDNVRIAEYYRIKETEDELIWMEDEQGEASTFFRSDVPAKYRKQIEEAEKDGHDMMRRPVTRRKLEWYKIAGNSIVKKNLKLKGRYVPVVRVVGIERVIDAKLHRRGHVRALKDPQRMYNYNSSGQVESGALATKSKWVGQKEAFEGNEQQWNNANVQNAAYLTVNGWDYEHEREIPMPVQVAPAASVPVFLDGMKIAEHEIDMASGQHEANDGRQGNERSGRAIAERQHQGDIATAHFNDHLALAICYTGKIILDWAPHVYTRERVIQIRGKDGVNSNVTVKPDLQAAAEQKKEQDTINVMFNPKKGKYIVEASIGPAYATQREEAWNAFVQIVTGAPDLINEIGDLMFRSADFPLADKIAERLRAKIRAEKPYLFDDQAPTPAQQQMAQQIKDLSEQVSQLLEKIATQRLKLVGKDQARDIQAHDSVSKRITAVSNAQGNLEKTGQLGDLQKLIEKATMDALSEPDLTGEVNQEQAAENNTGGSPDGGQQQQGDELPNPLPAPVPGAQRGHDGNWYLHHPDHGHMKVERLQ